MHFAIFWSRLLVSQVFIHRILLPVLSITEQDVRLNFLGSRLFFFWVLFDMRIVWVYFSNLRDGKKRSPRSPKILLWSNFIEVIWLFLTQTSINSIYFINLFFNFIDLFSYFFIVSVNPFNFTIYHRIVLILACERLRVPLLPFRLLI